ncbi:MAG: hypothetical protein WC331_10775 [Candidatus Omnitrophota bacterium]|jgi:hypothetical protein
MKKEITWTLSTGKEAKVTVELLTSETINADGIKVAVKCCKMEIMARVEGVGIVGSGRPQKAQTAAARIGKLGITRENLDKINAAIAEVEATHEWKEKEAKAKKAEKENREYEAHRAKMRKVMGY